MYRIGSAVARGFGLAARGRPLTALRACRWPTMQRFISSSSMEFASDENRSTHTTDLDIDDIVPDDFFDGEQEAAQEFMDLTSAMMTGEKLDGNITRVERTGLEALTTNKQTVINREKRLTGLDKENGAVMNMERSDVDIPDTPISENDSENFARVERSSDEVGENDELHGHLKTGDNDYLGDIQISPDMLNKTMPRGFHKDRDDEDFLQSFLPSTATELHRVETPGFRACEGKKQRSGKKGKLDCHLVDLDDISPFDINSLRRFMTLDAEILGRRGTGLCAKCQRRVAKTIKQARNLGIMPHIDEFIVKDTRPMEQGPFHKTGGSDLKEESSWRSRTVL